MSVSTSTEVRVVKVTDSKAIKVSPTFWPMQATYHLEDGRSFVFTSGFHRRKKDAVAAGARLEAEVGNTKATWHDGTDLDGPPTFIVSKFTTGTDPVTGRWGLVVDWEDGS